jgi:hypothetical protein
MAKKYLPLKKFYESKFNLVATFVSSIIVAYQLSNFNIISSVFSVLKNI